MRGITALRLLALWLIAVLLPAQTSLFNTPPLTPYHFKYSYVPKKLHPHQVFPLTVMETGVQSNALPRFRFEKTPRNARLLIKRPLVIRNGDDRFYTLYFKAGEGEEVHIPSLFIDAYDDIIELPPQYIPVTPLPKRKDFCGVLATDMKIRYAQVSHYDESHYLVTLSLEAYEANLEDIYLEGYEEQGLEQLKRRFAKTTGEYYVVVPETQKELSFAYYNTVKERFVTLKSAIEINDATVVTQSDLNPKEDKFEQLKKYTFFGLAGFFFLMFLLTRDLFYLALGVAASLLLSNVYMPQKRICIKEGSALYVLPTATSNISTRVDHELYTPLLNTRGIYNKVELRPGIVGWVKNEDLCKH